jgi:hypothetical protein
MAVDSTSKRTRRAVLAGVFGGLVGVVAQAARPLTAAAEGETVKVGGDYYSATTRTTLKNSANDNDVFAAVTTGNGKALWGKSYAGTGVYAQSTVGRAVYATSDRGPAVAAISTKGNAVDAGSVKGEAVHASSIDGIAVVARNETFKSRAHLAEREVGVTGFGGVGVFGDGTEAGVGGYAKNGVGVDGQGRIGIHARAVAGGVALRVNGPASFNRSGVGIVPAGTDRVNIAVAQTNIFPITDKTFAIATLNLYRAGVHVDAAVCHPDSQLLTIRLSATVADDTPVGWMLLEKYSSFL